MKKFVTIFTSISLLVIGLTTVNFPDQNAQAITYIRPSYKKIKKVKNNSYWYTEIQEVKRTVSTDIYYYYNDTPSSWTAQTSLNDQTFTKKYRIYIKVLKQKLIMKFKETTFTPTNGYPPELKENIIESTPEKCVKVKGLYYVDNGSYKRLLRCSPQSLTKGLKQRLNEYLKMIKQKTSYTHHTYRSDPNQPEDNLQSDKTTYTYKTVPVKKISKKTYQKAKY